MGVFLPSTMIALEGQVAEQTTFDSASQTFRVRCRRDKRQRLRHPVTKARGRPNRRLRRTVIDLPMLGCKVELDIEYYEIVTGKSQRCMEWLPFVETGRKYTRRFCALVSGMCRVLSISEVANAFDMKWDTVKSIDKRYLQQTLPDLNPGSLTGLKILGVDEVARAKGQAYVTVVYNLVTGQLVWVGKGRTAEVFSGFLAQLDRDVAAQIEAVAMDMGPAYAKAVTEMLPNAKIVYDRFHVMQNYSKVIDIIRRQELKRASAENKELLKGSRFLVLKNAKSLTEDNQAKLAKLLTANEPLNTVYTLKEQLQQLWVAPGSFQAMYAALVAWCVMARNANLAPLTRFADSLEKHAIGICNYASYPITNARVEAGNVAIGMIRKRARGMLDIDYFMLKIQQVSRPGSHIPIYRAG